jgi:hypothetical protein
VKPSLIHLFLLPIVLLGCDRATGGTGSGEIDVRWTGGERGRLSGPASADWCAPLRLLEIRGISGDTGVALAIYPKDSVTPGKYRLIDPARAESLPPAAALALRWAAQTAVKGFRGESGSVSVERSGSGALSGRVAAAARSVTDTQTLAIEGSFSGLVIRSQPGKCVERDEESDEDAGSGET